MDINIIGYAMMIGSLIVIISFAIGVAVYSAIQFFKCKHEYVPWVKHSEEDHIEYWFICRKCEKRKSIKVYTGDDNSQK